MSKLSEKTMLVALSISRWSGRKVDARASNALTEGANAAAGSARVNKDLIPRGPIKAINQAYDTALLDFKHMTLPWSDDGRRLLPAELAIEFTEKLQRRKAEFSEKVDGLLETYTELREQAQLSLGELFNADDYPTEAQIRTKFTFAWTMEPVPDSDDIRVQLPEDMRAEVAKQLDDQSADRLREASVHIVQRVRDMLVRISGVLGAEKPRIYTSLLDDAAALVAVLPAMNIANDPAVTELHTRLQEVVDNMEYDALRKEPELRSQVTGQANSVLNAMELMFA